MAVRLLAVKVFFIKKKKEKKKHTYLENSGHFGFQMMRWGLLSFCRQHQSLHQRVQLLGKKECGPSPVAQDNADCPVG